MHNPPLADAVNRVVDAIRRDGKLEKRLYELIVLITARHAGAPMPGRCTIRSGARRACRGDVVEAIQRQNEAEIRQGRREGDLRGGDRTAQHQQGQRAAYQEMIKQFGLEPTIEIVACVGLYCMIGAVINAFEVPTPNGEKPF